MPETILLTDLLFSLTSKQALLKIITFIIYLIKLIFKLGINLRLKKKI